MKTCNARQTFRKKLRQARVERCGAWFWNQGFGPGPLQVNAETGDYEEEEDADVTERAAELDPDLAGLTCKSCQVL